MSTGGTLLIWSPSESGVLQQLLAAFRAVVLRPGASFELSLLIPHDVYPGCNTPETPLDIWWHPVFADKWKAMVAKVEFLQREWRQALSTLEDHGGECRLGERFKVLKYFKGYDAHELWRLLPQ